jgi:outer membrane protein OmpA-like peptidoglycan-associated protein
MLRVGGKGILLIVTVVSFAFLTGCMTLEWSPKYYTLVPKDLRDADRAVENAQKAGKDKECPNDFNAAKAMRDKAYMVYWKCDTFGAMDIAKVATAKANDLCPGPKVIAKMSLMVNFGFDKADITDHYQKELDKAVGYLNKYPDSRIIVEGHTCNIGSNEYNQNLSERRAYSVKKYLIDKGGIDGNRIEAVGYGEEKPMASNDTREGRARNRRVDLIIMSR